MDLDFEILNESHSVLLNEFSCIEDNESLKRLGFNKNERKKIKRHSENMDAFLKTEALYEQNKNLNTTHLLINKDCNDLVGFVSLCNDCIPLEIDEKEGYGFTYSTIPALKIARLAVSNKYQHQGFSEKLFQYVIYKSITIRNSSGVAFITLDCYKHRIRFYEKKFGFIKNTIQSKSNADDPPTSMHLHINEYLEKLARID